jgi:beta-lactamase class A
MPLLFCHADKIARKSVLLSVLLALPLMLNAQVSRPEPDALQAEVAALAQAHHGRVALFATDLATGQTVSLDPDLPVQTASTIKLAILYEALEQMREGKVHLQDRITLTTADQVPGSGVLRLLDAPLGLTFKDVLTLMIVLSDNSSTNLAIDHLGLSHINNRMAAIGLKGTYLYKKVFTPNPPGAVMPADQPKFGLGKSTPREMATLMTKIVTCDLAAPDAPAAATDAALCGVALNLLHLQFYRNAVPHYLDSLPGATGDSIANKTGSLDAVRADVAAISSREGLIVISCFTFNNRDHTWGAEQEGELTIAKIAREVVKAWSPEGLAAWPVLAKK